MHFQRRQFQVAVKNLISQRALKCRYEAAQDGSGFVMKILISLLITTSPPLEVLFINRSRA